MLYQDVLQKDIAEKTGINLRTLSRRFTNPDDFTVDELIRIGEMLNIKIEFEYAAASIQTLIKDISISPSVSNMCYGCWYYEQQKANPDYTITVSDIPCTWCPKMKITCEAKNNDK